MIERALIDVTGLVQGVGFRPFVHSLATSLDLRGFVQNRGSHLFVDIEGEPDALAAFVERLSTTAPPLAAIDRVDCQRTTAAAHQHFMIAGSQAAAEFLVRVPPDVATCEDCRRELFDPSNRRYRHPFITCTTCGPRFTIVRQLPYDRESTAMAPFAMCPACRAEYTNPRDRRFHAQAIACPECGPILVARDAAGVRARGEASLRLAVRTLLEGGIMAVKGLGGFHLACDATNVDAVAELRRRKRREAKPLAVMLPGTETLDVDGVTSAVLGSRERPIVLVDRSRVPATLAPNIAENCPTVGVLLPYTPIHSLLLHDVGRPLVMTSGNRSDEPMVRDDDAALEQLAGIADAFLTHDRRIDVRCDDSVVRVSSGRTSIVRRARGYAPAPLTLAEHAPVGVLAIGGHLKNTLCLASGDRAYVSSHIGDLESAASYLALGETATHLTGLFGIQPNVVAHDLHPDYLSTRFAIDYPATSCLAVQHHHAHVLSCLAEHGCTEPVIGVACDGAGLGTDGAIWGGEFLVVDGTACHRAAHLAYVPLPGGDAAAREPWRMAVSHLAAAYGLDLGPLSAIFGERIAPARLGLARQMIARGTNAPPTSSIGRLFDAVTALIGLRDCARFEGQAAMELEALATDSVYRRYGFDLDSGSDVMKIHAAPVIRDIARDVLEGRSREEISSSFHEAVATMIAEVASGIARRTGIRRVALTGGVFQNALLARQAAARLRAARLDVLEHRSVPCNDGGLSLGQALLAIRKIRSGTLEEHIACA